MFSAQLNKAFLSFLPFIFVLYFQSCESERNTTDRDFLAHLDRLEFTDLAHTVQNSNPCVVWSVPIPSSYSPVKKPDSGTGGPVLHAAGKINTLCLNVIKLILRLFSSSSSSPSSSSSSSSYFIVIIIIILLLFLLFYYYC